MTQPSRIDGLPDLPPGDIGPTDDEFGYSQELVQSIILADRAAQAAKQVPEGWVPCTITYAEGEDPEEVAFGPQRMMDRLKKWLDSYFEKVYADRYPIAAAPSATSLAEAAEAGQEKSQLAKDFPPMGGLTECDMGDSYE